MPRFASAYGKAETSLDDKFKNLDYIRKTLEARVARAEEEIRDKFATMIERELKGSRVMRFLRNPEAGPGGYDLPAEFGLNDQDVQLAITAITHIVKRSIDLSSLSKTKFLPSRKSVIAEFRFLYLEPKMYEGLISDGFRYTSTKQYLPGKKRKAIKKIRRKYPDTPFNSEIEIPWGKWLMQANRGIGTIKEDLPNISEYGISYNLNPLQQAISRSGRALMLSGHRQRNLKRIDSFPYDFPKGAKPLAGYRNFVDEIANDESFQKRFTNEVLKIINKILFPRKR